MSSRRAQLSDDDETFGLGAAIGGEIHELDSSDDDDSGRSLILRPRAAGIRYYFGR
jgi:hypothetical protein